MPTVAQVFDFLLGGNIASYVRTVTDDPGVNPGPDATPTFDPMFGFPKGRKERGMINYKLIDDFSINFKTFTTLDLAVDIR